MAILSGRPPNRGNLVTALREKYFSEAKVSTKDFEGWKPDEVHEVNVKTWELLILIVFLLYW